MERRLVPVLAATALALAACGGGGDGNRGTSAGPHPQTSPSGPSSPHTPPICEGCRDNQSPFAHGPVVIQGAQKGGTVTVVTHTGLGATLDPAETYQRDTLSIESGLVTRSLTQYRYDPVTRQMILLPDLSIDLGVHNDDFTKWKFTLRRGIRFENGAPVTAKTVAWGIRRCLDATTFPTGPCQYYLNPNLKDGASYRGPYTAPHQVLRSVWTRGDSILLRFARPFPDLPYLAALPALGPVPLGSRSDPATYRTHPLATGPYRIAGYRPGHALVLARNPRWDPVTDPGRTAYPDGYDFRAGLSSQRIDRVLLADRGRAQTTLTYDDVTAADYPRWARSARHRLTLGATPCTTYLAPDNRTVTDPRVRRALSWAYPYRAVIRAEGQIPGVTVVPATNLLPPGIPGRIQHDSVARRGFDTNATTARSLLRKAGATGLPIRFAFDPQDPTSVRVKDALVRALTAAGFAPRPEASYTGTSLPGRAPGPRLDLRTVTRCGDWPSGGQWLPPVYGSNGGPGAGRGSNLEAFSKPGVDRRIAAIERLPYERQQHAWSRLDNTTLQQWYPIVPVSYSGVAMAHGSRIRGMADDAVRGMPTWGQIWVAPAG
jgi:peptide/nickel transport system substrate-binding protein